MSPEAIIRQAYAEGVKLTCSSNANIKARGNASAVHRWLPVISEHKATLLKHLATHEGECLDLENVAVSLAHEYGLDVQYALAILDNDDREAIRTRRDPNRLDAWRESLRFLSQRGTPPLPVRKAALEMVRCADCSYAKSTGHPALADCAARVPSMAAVGPYQRWKLASISCQKFQARSEDYPAFHS